MGGKQAVLNSDSASENRCFLTMCRKKKPARKLCFATDGVKMLWQRQNSILYQRLSFNIMREVSTYFQGAKEFVVADKFHVHIFDVDRGTTKTISVQLNFPDFNSAFMLANGNVFIYSGWIHGFLENLTWTYVIEPNGKIWSQPHAKRGHQDPGVAYDPNTDIVYLFGGRGSSGPLRICDIYLLRTAEWRRLPNMSTPRHDFTPCLHEKAIYICGGFGHDDIEILSTVSHEFIEPPHFHLPSTGICVSVVLDNELIAISTQFICRWNFRTRRSRVEHTTLVLVYCFSPPVVVGRSVFMIGLGTPSGTTPELLCLCKNEIRV